MTQVKRRHYTDFISTNQAPFVASSVSPLLVATHSAPHSTTDTFLRARVEFMASADVGTADPPLPESWWTFANIVLLAFWVPSSAATVGPSFGTSEHFLGSQLITGQLYPSPTDPGSYYVMWTQEEPMILDTARKDVTATSGPRVNIGITWYDPYSILTGAFASIPVNYQGRLFTLWGSDT